MPRLIALMLALLGVVSPAAAQTLSFPAAFVVREIEANGTTIHVRVGGQGPAVLLLHGYGETGDMWAAMATDLARDHTVVVPDLRGMGLSAKPAGGYDKKNQAADVAGVLDTLRITQADVVAHDIGNMVAFAFAIQHPERVTRLVLIDAPVPGIGPWEEVLKNPLLWHFRFGGPDMERLVAGNDIVWRKKLGFTPVESPKERQADRNVLWAAFKASGVAQGRVPSRERGRPAADAAAAHIGRAGCHLALLPLEDAVAAEEQPNLPGTTNQHPNWRRRFDTPVERMLAEPAVEQRLRGLARARRAP